MNRQQKRKAMPLCLPNNLEYDPKTGLLHETGEVRDKLYIVDEAVEQLRKIKEPVSVVSIVGPCRDGKSFILSEAFGQSQIFPVGFKMDPETMGIWIWILPHTVKDPSGRDVKVVLLDTEGTNFTGAKEQTDNQIFILTVLMASVLIYNSKGVPKRNELNELDYIARLSQQIQARSDIGTKRPIRNEDAFHQTFPHFIWLLRDNMTELPNDCKNIKEYFLTRVFKGEEATKNDQNHRVAESILHYFSGFDVFSLPIPSYDKELMKDVKGNMDKMNPQFFTGVKQFEELLRSIMGPKRSCKEGEYVTGEGLAALTTLYVEAINDPHNVPNVQTAWETFVNIKCEGAKKKAITAYEKKAKEELSKLPCDDEEILRGNDSATREMMATFEQETHGISIDHTKPYLEELTKLRFQKLGEWKNENDKKTRESCEKLVKRLRKKHLDPVLQRVSGPEGTNVSFKDIDDGCAVLELEYKSQAVGSKDVRAKVLHEFHQQFQIERERYKDVLKTLKDYNETLLLIRLQNTKAEKEKEDLRKQNDYLKQEMKIQEDKIKELDRKRAIELQEKLEEFQAKESILNTKIHDLEKAGMKDKITGLERERDDAKEDNERLKRELASVKSKLADLTEQVRLLNRPWWQRW